MIRSLRRTKWLALVKIPAFVPTQSRCVTSLESLRCMSTVVSAQGNSGKSSFSISSLISGPATEVVRFESSKKPKLVLKFLKDCGFSESQIKSIVSRWPLILMSDPKKTLKPKVDFLLSKGISIPDFVRIVSEEPKALTRSLEKHLIPLFDFLESVVGSEENAARAVRNYPYIFRSSIRRSLELNAMKLQSSGVPKSHIAKLILNRFRAIAPHPSRFEEALSRVKEMGFEPTDYTFGTAIAAIGWCSKPAWEGKMDLFRSYGLSDAEIVAGFKKQPMIMMFKKENTTSKMNFFVKRMHWCPHKVIMAPRILMLSLENRIIPRLSVLYVLVHGGDMLKTEVPSVQYLLKMSETAFVQKFVTMYQDKVPEVLDAHKGKLKIGHRHALLINPAFKKNEYLSGS